MPAYLEQNTALPTNTFGTSISSMYKELFLSVFISVSVAAIGQVQIDKSVQLTGVGNDARLSGIKSTVALQDAVSADVIQKSGVLYAVATGSNNAFNLNLAPAPLAYAEGMEVRFRANHAITGAATINVNGLGAKAIKKNVTVDLSACDVAVNQIVCLIYDGTNFQIVSPLFSSSVTANAGADQSVVGNTTTLAGNNPAPGTGTWSIQSGTGGTLGNANSYNSTFSGNLNSTYVLRWTVTNACGVSSFDDVSVDFQTAVKRVFVTAAYGSGNFNTWTNSGGLSGLAAADRICKYDANNPYGAGSGNWKAYLSTTTVNAKDRIQDAEYRRTDGITIIANNKADLVDGSLDNAILAGTNSVLVWTGTNTDGTYFTTPGACADWTVGTGNNSVIGKAIQANSEWSVYTYNYGCTGTNVPEGGSRVYMYCFED